MQIVLFSMTVTLLVGGLIVSGYFLKIFRDDQHSMRKVLIGLLAENRTQKALLEKQSEKITAIKREFDLREQSLSQSNDISAAIDLAQQGATVDQLVMALNISQSEAAMIISNYGDNTVAEKEELSRLYLA